MGKSLYTQMYFRIQVSDCSYYNPHTCQRKVPTFIHWQHINIEIYYFQIRSSLRSMYNSTDDTLKEPHRVNMNRALKESFVYI